MAECQWLKPELVGQFEFLEGRKPTLIGVAAGLALTAMGVRLMASLLFGVSEHNLRTFALVPAVVVGVGPIATRIPAWRATRVNPVETLRAE